MKKFIKWFGASSSTLSIFFVIFALVHTRNQTKLFVANMVTQQVEDRQKWEDARSAKDLKRELDVQGVYGVVSDALKVTIYRPEAYAKKEFVQ